MGHRPWGRVKLAALGAAVALGVMAGTAQAKPWAKWAPSPLASDSGFAAMSARPADSLGTGEFAWLTVQRDWREQRAAESPTGRATSATWGKEPPRWHRARSTDGRFAALASRPYASLANEEFAWLVSESAAQREDRERMSAGGHGATVAALVVAAGLAGLYFGMKAAVDGIFGGD
jgi:hypothetical protein